MSRYLKSIVAVCALLGLTAFIYRSTPATGNDRDMVEAARVSANVPITGADKYFVIVFSYQDVENHVMKSHTFASFVKVPGSTTEDGNDDRGAARFVAQHRPKLEVHTISWLPAKFDETLRLTIFKTPGKNFSLAETLDLARRLETEVFHWGPFEIDAKMYDRALQQIAKLDSGEIGYKMYNASSSSVVAQSTVGVSQCIHAVGDVCGRFDCGVKRGHDAGEAVVRHFSPSFKSSRSPNWLFDAVMNSEKQKASGPVVALRETTPSRDAVVAVVGAE